MRRPAAVVVASFSSSPPLQHSRKTSGTGVDPQRHPGRLLREHQPDGLRRRRRGDAVRELHPGPGVHLSVRLFDGIFRDGDIALRWDEGAVERHTFADNDQSLSVATFWGADDYNPSLASIIDKLKTRSSLRVRVGRWPSTTVTDRLSLRGSGRAIGALGCG